MLTTDRLQISKLSYDDCEFILRLLSEPAFIRYIGDRGVRTLDDARDYLREGPIASYATNGFGLFLVCCIDDGMPLGICA
jgi:ribosomal-protein-alanine N-acetyltransferase